MLFNILVRLVVLSRLCEEKQTLLDAARPMLDMNFYFRDKILIEYGHNKLLDIL